MTTSEMEQLGAIAGRHAMTPSASSGAGMLFSKACALAAVEVLEGSPRALRLSRRRSGFERLQREFAKQLVKAEHEKLHL
jgi:hypothetical protein